MSIKELIKFHEGAAESLRNQLSTQEEVLVNLYKDIRNHVYTSLEEAGDVLSEGLESEAHQDCEGKHNCGNETYSQDFIVGNVMYTATMTFEYGRHDKTYYYIESAEYFCKEKF